MAAKAELPSIKDISSAYQANVSQCSHVLQIKLISSSPRIVELILEYLVTYRSQDGQIKEESFIGKMYSDDEKGFASYQFLQYLWKNGFTIDPRFTVVRPIAYLQQWKLLLMSKAPGKRLDDWLYDSNTDGKQTAFLIANWLTRMHTMPVIQASIQTRDFDIKRLYKDLSTLLAEGTLLKTTYHQFQQKLSHPFTNEIVLLHGDFHTRNIFMDDSQVVAIDFDHHFVGDPAWDVAYLACQIQLSSFFKKGDFHFFQPVIQHFIDTYLHAHPNYNRELFFDRLALYSAHSLLESLHYELCVLKTGKLTLFEPFLTKCLLNLQGNGFK